MYCFCEDPKAFKDFRKDLLEYRRKLHQGLMSLRTKDLSEQDTSLAIVDLYQERRMALSKSFAESRSDTIINSPRRIIFLPALVNLAVGNFFDLDPSDYVRAFKAEKKRLKKNLFRVYKSDEYLHHLGFSRTEDDVYTDFISNTFCTEKFFNNFLKRFPTNDTTAFSYLLEKRYQRAIWRLREVGEYDLASKLEKVLRYELLSDKNNITTEILDLGYTDTFLMHYHNNATVLYKPKAKFFPNPIKFISTSPKKEAAAYAIDKMLKLDSVPMTYLCTHKDKGFGSSQFFVSNSYRARDIKEYNGVRPRKFTSTTGRIEKHPHMVLFDWLTDNNDRNADNYMILDSGKVVYIDHSFSFMEVTAPRKLTRKHLITMIPNKAVFKQLQKIRRNPDIAYSKLRPYLSQRQIKIFVKKIKLLVKKLEKNKNLLLLGK